MAERFAFPRPPRHAPEGAGSSGSAGSSRPSESAPETGNGSAAPRGSAGGGPAQDPKGAPQGAGPRSTSLPPQPPAAAEAPEVYEPQPAEVQRPPRASRKRKLTSWVERRATKVASKIYKTQADDIQERASRAVSQVYEERADDLEERAVRALRRAISEEADRFKEVIEHAVAVKKREVRLSLLVLIAAALLYFLLDWFSKAPPA